MVYWGSIEDFFYCNDDDLMFWSRILGLIAVIMASINLFFGNTALGMLTGIVLITSTLIGVLTNFFCERYGFAFAYVITTLISGYTIYIWLR